MTVHCYLHDLRLVKGNYLALCKRLHKPTQKFKPRSNSIGKNDSHIRKYSFGVLSEHNQPKAYY